MPWHMACHLHGAYTAAGVIRHRALWPHRKTLSAMLGQSHLILTLSASVLAQNTDEKELVTRRAET